MAANTLTTTYEDIQKEVAIQLGWGRTPGKEDSLNGDWTKENFTDFGLWCKEGYRQFLYPEPLPGENKSHNWSFLYPLGKLELTPSYSHPQSNPVVAGTCVISSGVATLNGTAESGADFAWPLWVAQGDVWVTDPSATTGVTDIDITPAATFAGASGETPV